MAQCTSPAAEFFRACCLRSFFLSGSKKLCCVVLCSSTERLQNARILHHVTSEVSTREFHCMKNHATNTRGGPESHSNIMSPRHLFWRLFSACLLHHCSCRCSCHLACCFGLAVLDKSDTCRCAQMMRPDKAPLSQEKSGCTHRARNRLGAALFTSLN